MGSVETRGPRGRAAHGEAMNDETLDRRLRASAALALAGLLVEAVSLRWSHPTAFLFFLLLGGALMALGIAVYLLSLVSAENKPSAE